MSLYFMYYERKCIEVLAELVVCLKGLLTSVFSIPSAMHVLDN